MPVFRANENVDLTQTDFAGRGTSGPVQVSFVDKNDPAIAGFKFVMAASFGVSERTDYCHPDGMNGFFPFQLSIKRGSCNATSGPCVSTRYIQYLCCALFAKQKQFVLLTQCPSQQNHLQQQCQ